MRPSRATALCALLAGAVFGAASACTDGPTAPDPNALADLTLWLERPEATVGDTIRLRADLLNNAGEKLEAGSIPVTWELTDTSVLACEFPTYCVGKKAGTAIVRARARTLSAEAEIRVVAAPPPVVASLAFPLDSVVLNAGSSQQLRATARLSDSSVVEPDSVVVQYASSDTTVAKVSAAGTVTAIAPGVALVRATLQTLRDSVVVTVVQGPPPPVTGGMNVELPHPTMAVGDTQIVRVSTVMSSPFGPIKITADADAWWSLSPDVVQISATGRLTAVASGSAEIRGRKGTLVASAVVVVVGPGEPALFSDISAGASNCGLRVEDGVMVCWGVAVVFQPGMGPGPPRAISGPGYARIAAGGPWATCALNAAGRADCFDSPSISFPDSLRFRTLESSNTGNTGSAIVCGILADSTVACRHHSGVRRPLGDTKVRLLGFDETACAVRVDDTVLCWWTGDTTSAPRVLSGLPRVEEIAVGMTSQCFRVVDGAVWCGNELWRADASPAPVAGIPPMTAVTVGGSRQCGITATGDAWCWTVALAPVAGTAGAVQISANGTQTCVRKPDNTAWCWGNNFNGGLGDATTIDRAHAVQVRRSY